MLPLLSILPYVLVSTTTMRWKPMIFITLMKATLTHYYSNFLLKNKKNPEIKNSKVSYSKAQDPFRKLEPL